MTSKEKMDENAFANGIIGLSMSDLDLLTIGMVLDIWTEKGNDDYKYGEKETVRTAGQHDFDSF